MSGEEESSAKTSASEQATLVDSEEKPTEDDVNVNGNAKDKGANVNEAGGGPPDKEESNENNPTTDESGEKDVGDPVKTEETQEKGVQPKESDNVSKDKQNNSNEDKKAPKNEDEKSPKNEDEKSQKNDEEEYGCCCILI
ncbi:protein MNN4-like [Xenia sp. Carnegie-2017]|uniref:protein MNN4-like n=1 Tax=Xenia sp. Carnegie-2017 TaxID=2897299 RepID=UPI001F043316|nr:protein MNN4-like [Xenia sp. Carnegie-2017]